MQQAVRLPGRRFPAPLVRPGRTLDLCLAQTALPQLLTLPQFLQAATLAAHLSLLSVQESHLGGLVRAVLSRYHPISVPQGCVRHCLGSRHEYVAGYLVLGPQSTVGAQ
ncbi:hypothetical protein NDU88_006638 [Pleurodeles waltl]|uniref:Uncharacterized protein n=1 Tax=Pleurodeles waltl TaxID=8319 RepID=A0AAV7UNC5_PLEWA|nr:hypothetical protein NDU88_006638 [Pleurodeles waltl]